MRRETLWAWARRHEEFDEAVGVCKAIQEDVLVTMGLLSAYAPGLTIFTLKNLLGWEDKMEGGVRSLAGRLARRCGFPLDQKIMSRIKK